MGIAVTVQVSPSTKNAARLQRNISHEKHAIDRMTGLGDQLKASFYTIAVHRIRKEYLNFATTSATAIRELPPPDLNPTKRLTKTCCLIAKNLEEEKEWHVRTRSNFDAAMNLNQCEYHALINKIASQFTLRPEDLSSQIRSFAEMRCPKNKRTEKTATQMAKVGYWHGLATRLTYDIATIGALMREEESKYDTTDFLWGARQRLGTGSGRHGSISSTATETTLGNDGEEVVWRTPTGRVANIFWDSLPPPPSTLWRRSSVPKCVRGIIARRRGSSSNGSDIDDEEEDKMIYLQRLHCLLREVRDRYFVDVTTFVYEGKYQLVYLLKGDALARDSMPGCGYGGFQEIKWEKVELIEEREGREGEQREKEQEEERRVWEAKRKRKNWICEEKYSDKLEEKPFW